VVLPKLPSWNSPRAVSRTEQCWTITGTEVADWLEVIIARVDRREKGMRADSRAKEIAAANGWKLALRAPQWAGQRRNLDTYEGKETGLVMTIITRGEEIPARQCVDSPYMVNEKRVVRELEVYKLHRDSHAHNCYTDKEAYRVSSRMSEHGPYAPPQWTPNYRKDRCRDCGDWRHQRCGQNMKQPVCNLCQGLHLDRGYARGVESRENHLKRKREIERLIQESERKERKFRSVEEEMDVRYEPGKEPDRRKTHRDQRGHAGKARNFRVD